MSKTRELINDLDKTLACYMGKVEKLEKSQREFNKETKDYIRKCVWESMQSWVNSGHQNIITKIIGWGESYSAGGMLPKTRYVCMECIRKRGGND